MNLDDKATFPFLVINPAPSTSKGEKKSQDTSEMKGLTVGGPRSNIWYQRQV